MASRPIIYLLACILAFCQVSAQPNADVSLAPPADLINGIDDIVSETGEKQVGRSSVPPRMLAGQWCKPQQHRTEHSKARYHRNAA